MYLYINKLRQDPRKGVIWQIFNTYISGITADKDFGVFLHDPSPPIFGVGGASTRIYRISFIPNYGGSLFGTGKITVAHRLQLYRNLRDSPGFLAIVPGTRRLYYSCIVDPGQGADTSINTSILLQLMNFGVQMNKLLVVVCYSGFCSKNTLGGLLGSSLEIHFLHHSHQNQSFRVWCGWGFNQ